ncbi:hypothetical protein D915_001549 [Fasciola hepatica]|uniref:Uncharacterized protein n=1 Tax=Fasciola hepatica TaxID=6192 RepID=A0A4E0RF13_FASHE|nr:hypothetical protein D915_001549 [Fasciola hepatica]
MLSDITKAFADYFVDKTFDSFADFDKHVRVFQRCTETLYAITEQVTHPDRGVTRARYACYLNVLPADKPPKSGATLWPNECQAFFEVSLLLDGSYAIANHYLVHTHEIGCPGYLLQDHSDMLTSEELETVEPKLVMEDSIVIEFAWDKFKKQLTDADVEQLRQNYEEATQESCDAEQRRLCLSPDLFILGLPAWDITPQFEKYLSGKLFDSYDAFLESLRQFEEATGSIYTLRDARKLTSGDSTGELLDKLVYKLATFRCTNPRTPQDPGKGPVRQGECRAYLKIGTKFNSLCIVAANNQHSHFFYPRGRLLRQTNVRCAPKRPPPPPPTISTTISLSIKPRTVDSIPSFQSKTAPPTTPKLVEARSISATTLSQNSLLASNNTPSLSTAALGSVTPVTPVSSTVQLTVPSGILLSNLMPVVPAAAPATTTTVQPFTPGTTTSPIPVDQKARFTELCPYVRLLALLVESNEEKYSNRKNLLLGLIEAWANGQKVDLVVHQLSQSAD